jgi:hypothetical protein
LSGFAQFFDVISWFFLLLIFFVFSIGSSSNPAHANNKCTFEIKTNLRVYYLMAECEEDKETWVAGMTNSMNYWKVRRVER